MIVHEQKVFVSSWTLTLVLKWPHIFVDLITGEAGNSQPPSVRYHALTDYLHVLKLIG